MWVKAYILYKKIKIYNIFENYLFLIFGYSKNIYSDNNLYFVNDEFRRVFIDYKIIYFTGLIIYLLNTGFLKKAV